MENHPVEPGVEHGRHLHWPEYVMEFTEMGLYLFFTCVFATAPASRLADSPAVAE